jgi:hypothetical protein
VDQRIGVLNVQPPDFDQLIERLHFHGNEAGPAYRYLNGGVWAHGNAWFILALNSIGARQEAYDFLCRTMNLHGVMASPNGQPAMYEYRCGDPMDSLLYGKVDKPQFLWAAGWYLYSLLAIYGLTENEWNLSLDPFLPAGQKEFTADWLVDGRKVRVHIRGMGPHIKRIRMDNRDYPSMVLPWDELPQRRVTIELGLPRCPYLASAGSAVRSVRLMNNLNQMELKLSAFPGHRSWAVIISPWPVTDVSSGGNPPLRWQVTREAGAFRVAVQLTHRQENETVRIQWAARNRE